MVKLDDESLREKRLKEEHMKVEERWKEQQIETERLKNEIKKENLKRERLKEENMKMERLRKEKIALDKLIEERLEAENLNKEECLKKERLKEEDMKIERLEEEWLKQERIAIDKLREERLKAESENKDDERSTVVVTNTITQTMMEMMKLQNAPKVEIDVFSGDPLEYMYFISNFKDMVESVVTDQRGRLNRLIQYTSGEPKDLIRHCIHNSSTHCYDDALALLNQEFGNPLRIACAYIEKLKNWPTIKYGDGAAYKALYRFLLQCQSYQKNGRLDGLDSPLLLRQIQLKLPNQGQDKWAQIVGKIRKREKREGTFKDFAEFIETEASVLNDPVYSREHRDKESEKIKTCATKEVYPIKAKCHFCEGKHHLDDCEQFGKIKMKERKQYIFTSRLCFSCLESGHRAKDCSQKISCKVCSKEHPTILHVFTTLAVGDEGAGAGMCVVPVRLLHESDPEKEIIVYALLDECSQGTFIKEDILMQFSTVEKTSRRFETETLHGSQTIESLAASGFSVKCSVKHESMNNLKAETVKLPKVYSRLDLPFNKNDVPSKEYLSKWEYLNRITMSLCEAGDNVPVGLLIGRNCPASLEPLEVIPSQVDGPYAYRTRLGWLVGDAAGTITNTIVDDTVKINFNRCQWPSKDVITNLPSKVCFSVVSEMKDLEIEQALKNVWNADTSEEDSEKMSLSMEDRRFLDIMKNNIRMVDGHYELPLPFRVDNPPMPCNRRHAEQRINCIKRKMLKDKSFHTEYTDFMMKFIDAGYARLATSKDEPGWFLLHHAVRHPTKGKIRVVFDGTFELKGVSLNNQLLQGPDLTNLMVGVFLRFRKEPVAIIGDLEAMYCQVRVPEHQRKYLRFLFWPDGNLEKELEVYEMCVHVFGAVSSMGCVNYALRTTADENKERFGSEAAETLKENFYVDDMATSVKDDNEAINLIRNTDSMCQAGGFNLTKIMCTSTAVMETVPIAKHSERLKEFNIKGIAIIERPLGVEWNVENDYLGFYIAFKSGAVTRRGMLAAINGVYDLFGIAAPFLLRGRKILQEITSEKVSWDADISTKHISAWNRWKEEIILLKDLKFSRCYKPGHFGDAVDISLHMFGDGCNIGYGAAGYIKQVNKKGEVSVSLVMGKSRVSPLKMITIPRLELTASTVAVKLGALIKDELKIKNVNMFYYSDSKVALGYICNDVKRFRVFVSNRHQLIRSYTKKEEWEHVDTKENPADDASRGLSMRHDEKVQRWLHGPKFLHNVKTDQDVVESNSHVADDDPEVIKVVNSCTVKPETILNTLEKRMSKWIRMKRTVAAVLLFVRKVKEKVSHNKSSTSTEVTDPEGGIAEKTTIKKTGGCKTILNQSKNEKIMQKSSKEEMRKMEKAIMEKITVEEFKEAEQKLILMVQDAHFAHELAELKTQSATTKTRKLAKKSIRRIYQLDPFVDGKDGMLRVGGRIRNSSEDEKLKFPVILPRKALISQRIAEHYHRLMEHGGRTSTINEIRANGYWIIGISGMVRSLIFRCVGCRIQRGAMGCQKMSNLPAERMSTEPPFTYCGVDMFGPFSVKEGRKVLKRYCALFTCMSSRAVHIEVTASMNTDSFIQALRRFVARRGVIRTIRSDNGGNFVGADNELQQAWEEMDHSKISDYLSSRNCDWIKWERNVPLASHMGGVWERQIRSVRNVLNSMMKSHARPLDNESFCTLMAEVEAIVNSRPLTIEDLNNPENMPLTPNHLLTLKSKVVMPPPGVFQEADVYCRKRWRTVQHLANTFWERWRKEYLQSLQRRNKWTEKKRNFMKGEIVLLKDAERVRNNWPMGVIVDVFRGEDGLVRSVHVKVATGSIMKRPIAKLVLLLESTEEITDVCDKNDDEE